MRLFTVLVQIPALDRLLDYLQQNDQTQARIIQLTERLTKSNARVKAALGKEE